MSTLSGRDKVIMAGIAALWAVAFSWFWLWWLQPGHLVSWVGMGVTSVLLLYLSTQACYFLIAVARLPRVRPSLKIPRLRLAIAVTRAPSEPWAMARRTLEAMKAQEFPYAYDVWLCDEDPSPEIYEWCAAQGIRVSTRKGVPEYNRSSWPRRTKCKEGNLAYFYDHWGYSQYDVVVQLDCDHEPSSTYLAEVVRPFSDEAIGYVAAPSICDANARTSWAARGRLYREAPFHGPFQLGHANRLAPVCIGSHYGVRTRALRDIGGLGPDLAEDFTTTFLFNSAGWQGAFAIDAEAHGLGPMTFADMVTQEYQWSRSLVAMMFGMIPRHMHRLPVRLRIRFTIVLIYYPLLALAAIAGLVLPAAASISGNIWVSVNYLAFLGNFFAMGLCMLFLLLLLRRRGLLRPHSAPVLSWELWLFTLARWPWVAWGVLGAIVQETFRRPIYFKVTPKDRSGSEVLPKRLVLPYGGIVTALSVAAVVGEMTGPAVGYVFLCILGACAYAVVGIAVSVLHVLEAAKAAGTRLRSAMITARTPLLLALAPLLPLALAIYVFPSYLFAVLGW
ncbi:glycosyltransferase [Streptomyces ipomoeae]|uniref:Glycosyltransferase, group 2 family n=1 Tax=Streptomyces ipomoeae 91-03 TaxID=698759 RepID=L1KYZ7_9ACTN|nr:glycosyltransferase family 2 protein [Streptomyces ipomoeae]EKX66051.1 glycosyltransferase, group 2 family [Streptomyces ipomoeae 91-03]MDX2693360.1 glycosyltransferase [Streptomyces ipomoeae]MDX2821509.1 glycosyltransferase [Streptomyces ipomoeae]MDX2838992.1 glycosyltransferase [Streptomyces ipomoeae]MDX2873992.1 glycosyltransferase [Streptomyces ipomoeae]